MSGPVTETSPPFARDMTSPNAPSSPQPETRKRSTVASLARTPQTFDEMKYAWKREHAYSRSPTTNVKSFAARSAARARWRDERRTLVLVAAVSIGIMRMQ